MFCFSFLCLISSRFEYFDNRKTMLIHIVPNTPSYPLQCLSQVVFDTILPLRVFPPPGRIESRIPLLLPGMLPFSKYSNPCLVLALFGALLEFPSSPFQKPNLPIVFLPQNPDNKIPDSHLHSVLESYFDGCSLQLTSHYCTS